jgi:16S rRNA G966 N2-methylase RsmD
MGEELARTELAKGAPGPGRGKAGCAPRPAFTDASTLAEIGITKDQSARYQRIAAVPADIFEQAIEVLKQAHDPISAASVARAAAEIEAREDATYQALVDEENAELARMVKDIRAAKAKKRRKKRDEELINLSNANAPLAADRLYPIIYADPPWQYDHMISVSREIENQYPTMDIDAICALDVAALAAPDTISDQALGAAYAAFGLDASARYEVHLDRKLEWTLAMLIRLRELRRPAVPA